MILASDDDGEAFSVAEELRSRGVTTARLNLADFPGRVRISAQLTEHGWAGWIDAPSGTIDLAAISAIFYRQSQPFTFPSELSASERHFATVEARFGLGGLLASLTATWVPGTPGCVADGEYKIAQVSIAARCGLRVPATALGNCPDDLRDFARAQQPGVVYKAIMHKVVADAGQFRFIYTTPIDPVEINGRTAITLQQLQANLARHKLFDVRMAVSRQGQHAIAIHSDNPAARQDFRTAYDSLSYELIQAPTDVIAGCRRYLRRMGLRFAVFDFAATPDGWFFFEAGPGAQWAWLEEATGAPISHLIADTLLGDPL